MRRVGQEPLRSVENKIYLKASRRGWGNLELNEGGKGRDYDLDEGLWKNHDLQDFSCGYDNQYQLNLRVACLSFLYHHNVLQFLIVKKASLSLCLSFKVWVLSFRVAILPHYPPRNDKSGRRKDICCGTVELRRSLYLATVSNAFSKAISSQLLDNQFHSGLFHMWRLFVLCFFNCFSFYNLTVSFVAFPSRCGLASALFY